MDEFNRRLVDEDEDAAAAPADRGYWESRGTKSSVSMADGLFKIVQEFDPALELKYNKFYIGLSKDGKPNNVVEFRPQKNGMIFEVRLNPSDELQQKINDAGIDTLEYSRWGYYRFKLTRRSYEACADLTRDDCVGCCSEDILSLYAVMSALSITSTSQLRSNAAVRNNRRNLDIVIAVYN